MAPFISPDYGFKSADRISSRTSEVMPEQHPWTKRTRGIPVCQMRTALAGLVHGWPTDRLKQTPWPINPAVITGGTTCRGHAVCISHTLTEFAPSSRIAKHARQNGILGCKRV